MLPRLRPPSTRAILAALLALLLAWLPPARAADDFLDVEQAFRFSARAPEPALLELRFDIAPGYYMYREALKFKAQGATLGEPQIPAGKIKFDATFNKDVEHYRDALVMRVPLAGPAPAAPFLLTVTSQGCADKGLCYPPTDSFAEVRPGAGGATVVRVLSEAQAQAWGGAAAATAGGAPGGLVGDLLRAPSAAPAQSSAPAAAPATAAAAGGGAESRIDAALRSGKVWAIAPLFVLLGLLLAFTPCVLPMVPILASIVVGDGPVSKLRGLALAATYGLGMALVYTALGVAAGLAGEGLAAALQKPWVLALFASLLVLLALSMFGFYELQLPASWQTKLSAASGRFQGGRWAGVFVMGGISALIVGPCVAAPLAGALLYISQTRDAVTGGIALFALATGMSLPLLLVGMSAGALLPKAGVWMERVKHLFGALLVATALWMLSPVLAPWLEMLAWGAFLLVCATFLHVFDPLPQHAHHGWQRLFKGVGVVLALLGAVQIVGVVSGGRDVLQPLGHFARAAQGGVLPPAGAAAPAGHVDAKGHLRFERVKTGAELDARLAAATRAGRPVMLDFYADWCVSCKEMERFTFTDRQVQALLAQAVLLQADVTANDADDRALLKRFALFGPPGIILFDAQGREVGRVIGYQDAARFAQSLSVLQAS